MAISQMGVRKPRPLPVQPLNIPLTKVSEKWKDIQQGHARVENAAILLCQDVGFCAFGGKKVEELQEALRFLRKMRAEYAREVLQHISESNAGSPEAVAFVEEVEAMCREWVHA